MNISDLSGPALNWAVAMCLGWKWKVEEGKLLLARPDHTQTKQLVNSKSFKVVELRFFTPDASWSITGPIIAKNKISLACFDNKWYANVNDSKYYGHTPLVAALRCFASMKFGKNIELPDVILKICTKPKKSSNKIKGLKDA